MERTIGARVSGDGDSGKQRVALDRADMMVFRDIMFLAAGPASERSRSPRAGTG
jgi:hypothetical protein